MSLNKMLTGEASIISLCARFRHADTGMLDAQGECVGSRAFIENQFPTRIEKEDTLYA